MDSVILIKTKDEDIYLGGDHIGQAQKFYKMINILIKLFLKKGVMVNQINQLSECLYEIDGTHIQDIECVIDKENKTVALENLSTLEITEDNNDLHHYQLNNSESLQSHLFTFEEFVNFYEVVKPSLKNGKAIINNHLLVRY